VSGHLLDINVLSEARKRRRADPGVRSWLAEADDETLFISVLVVGEIRKGVELARARDPGKARALDRWLLGLVRLYGDRVLPVTPAVADRWGRIAAARSLPVVDGLLAATALVHDLTLVTRNVDDVEGTGVRVFNPFGTNRPGPMPTPAESRRRGTQSRRSDRSTT
jgi:toxin FitB